jgi:hypothetical protein
MAASITTPQFVPSEWKRTRDLACQIAKHLFECKPPHFFGLDDINQQCIGKPKGNDITWISCSFDLNPFSSYHTLTNAGDQTGVSIRIDFGFSYYKVYHIYASDASYQLDSSVFCSFERHDVVCIDRFRVYCIPPDELDEGDDNLYKFRAECLLDVERALRRFRKDFGPLAVLPCKWTLCPWDPSIIFYCRKDLQTIKESLSKIVDGHVMYETVSRYGNYTGKRTFCHPYIFEEPSSEENSE